MESLSLLERISARLGEAAPARAQRVGERPVRVVLSPDSDGDESPCMAPCSRELLLSDSEDDKPPRPEGGGKSSERREQPAPVHRNNFRSAEQTPRLSARISDSSDEDFENFLVQLKTPKQPASRTQDKPSSRVKSFVVDSEDDDFDSMFSRGGKGSKTQTGTKSSVSGGCGPQRAAVSLEWKDSPVFISDSDEDSIVIRSTWSDRHKATGKPKAQKAKSVKENVLEPGRSSGAPGSVGKPVLPEPKCFTPVSSDEEFESLMDRIKNRTKNHTSSKKTGNPKAAPAVSSEPPKVPCLDLTNRKETKSRPQSCSDVSTSPYFSDLTDPLHEEEESRPGKMGFQCKVPNCFLKDLSHPTSVYVTGFKQKKQELTSRLYSLYNRTIFDYKLPENLEILWNKKMRKTAGYCVTGQKKLPTLQRYARIELSEKVCDSADRLRDTLIHEICHAATWLINGVRDGHGQYWRFYARKATLIHPELPMVTRCHTYEINYKFTYECSRCKNTIGRHSKSLDTERFVCALCKGKLVLQAPPRKDGSPATPQLTPFAKYVKENYGLRKKEMGGTSHAEVMRKLSADFSAKTKLTD